MATCREISLNDSRVKEAGRSGNNTCHDHSVSDVLSRISWTVGKSRGVNLINHWDI